MTRLAAVLAWGLVMLSPTGGPTLAAEARAFPAEERLSVLFIGPPHGYGGEAAADPVATAGAWPCAHWMLP